MNCVFVGIRQDICIQMDLRSNLGLVNEIHKNIEFLIVSLL